MSLIFFHVVLSRKAREDCTPGHGTDVERSVYVTKRKPLRISEDTVHFANYLAGV